MKNILVTGGAGFIGSHFVKEMIEKYRYTIVNLDLLTYAGNLENLEEVGKNARYTFVKGDIGDKILVEKIFTTYDIDAVVNFAAESHVDRSIKNPEIFLYTNVLGTQNLLEQAKKHWRRNSQDSGTNIYKPDVKFLQVSTDEVYGELGAEGFFTEESPLAPNSPYSASKASADLLVRAYHKTFGLPVNITRCSNNYGPYQFPEKLIPLMIHNAIKGKKLPVYGDGKQVRDWLHVRDHCRAIDRVLHEGQAGEVYNIGGNQEKTNIEIVRYILGYLHKNDSLIEYVEDRPGHDRRYAIDSGKIKSTLGWQAGYGFEEGMAETIQWYLENEQWLEKITSGEYQAYYENMYGKKGKWQNEGDNNCNTQL